MKITINNINTIIELNEDITLNELKSIIEIWNYCKFNFIGCEIMSNAIYYMGYDMGTLEEYNEEMLFLLLSIGIIDYRI